jgi:hypothetical protein
LLELGRTFPERASSRLRVVIYFITHQTIGAAGIGALVALFASSLLRMLRLMPSEYLEHVWYWVFAYRPYFPVQIITGLAFGWILARRLGHREMIWVWIIPLLILCCAIIGISTLTPEITSPLLWSRVNQSWFTHYLGEGCRIRDHCFDQVLVTQPFYTAAAYSIGARLAFLCGSFRPGNSISYS